MTAREMLSRIDTTALLGHEGLAFAVRICDGKAAYGQTRYLVTPINGTGCIWVNADSLRFLPTSR